MGNTADTPSELSDADKKRCQDKIIQVAITNSIVNATQRSLADLFLLRMSASALHIGILAAINSLQILVRMVGLKLLPRTGKANLGSLGRLLSLPAVVLIALIAFFATRIPNIAVWATLALFAIRGVFASVAETGWWPLLQDNTSEGSIGAFLARMRFRLRVLDITLPIVVGWYLGNAPSPGRFAPLFLISALSLTGSVLIFRKIPETPIVTPSIRVIPRLYKAIRLPSVRMFCIYSVAFVLVNSLIHDLRPSA